MSRDARGQADTLARMNTDVNFFGCLCVCVRSYLSIFQKWSITMGVIQESSGSEAFRWKMFLSLRNPAVLLSGAYLTCQFIFPRLNLWKLVSMAFRKKMKLLSVSLQEAIYMLTCELLKTFECTQEPSSFFSLFFFSSFCLLLPPPQPLRVWYERVCVLSQVKIAPTSARVAREYI